MAFPNHADFVIIGAGVHGLSTAWRLAERLSARGEEVEGRIVVLDKSGELLLKEIYNIPSVPVKIIRTCTDTSLYFSKDKKRILRDWVLSEIGINRI